MLPVTTGTRQVLDRIESPLLAFMKILQDELSPKNGGDSAARVAAAAARFEKSKPGLEGFVETVFCFIHPPDHLRGLLDQGRPVFRNAAMKEIADKLSPVAFDQLLVGVSKHFSGSLVAQRQPQPAEK